MAAGSIDYEEFLAATVNLNHLEKEETMYNAFQYFDTDNSGYITEQEMEDALRVRDGTVLGDTQYHVTCFSCQLYVPKWSYSKMQVTGCR